MTGSSELNHSEALNSGAIQAQESLELFPRELKVVSLYLALTAQRSSFNLVVNDVYLFMKDRYFVGEVLQACLEGKSWSNCTILQVCEPSEQEVEDYNKIAVVNLTDEHKLFPPACLYKYRVQKFCSYNDINHVFEASASHVRRKKRLITKEKLRQFLKSCLVLDSRGIWVVQESVVQNFCIHSLKFSDIFVGSPPKFPARYEKLAKKVKKNSPKNPLDQSVRSGAKKMKVAKSPRRDKNCSMSSNEDLCDFKNVVLNHSTESLNSVVPCRVLVRKLSDGDGSRKIIKKVKKKYVKPEGEKENLNQGSRKKNTTWRGMTWEERQKLKEKKAKRALLDKLKRKEEKLKLKEKLKEEKLKMALMLKDHNRLREDLECEDLKPLPIPHAVNCSRIPNELFGDFMFIVEFFHCFKNIVNTKHAFPRGIKCNFLEQALTENNLNGMLTKITVFLLKELYKMQGEDNEPVECDMGVLDVIEETGDISATDAIRLVAAEYGGQLYNGAFANEIILNHLTVTEVLRLHFLSCGGRRWDPNRISSVDPGDPATVLRTQLPHLLDNLCNFHLCELSLKEKIAILNCLVDEILACPPLREELDKRSEELKQKKIELRALKAAEVRKTKEAEAQRIKEKKEAGLKLKQQDNAVVIPEPESEELKTELIEKELRSSRKKIDFKEMHVELRTLAMNIHLCPIGIDRAHRRFWVFSSIPGLFVEQKAFEVGPCLLQPTPREPLSPRSGGKASSRKNSPHKSPRKEVGSASYNACQSRTSEPVRTESWVCSSSVDCRIHGRTLNDSKWSYFQREEEITLLLENLNKRGLRENELRKILLKEENWVKECVSKCPLYFIDPSLAAEINQEPTSKMSVVEENPEETVPSILQIILRDRILDLENKIASGCLGCLEVKDLQVWRESIENGGYDMQCDQLTWGMYSDPKEKDGTESSDSTEKNIICSNLLNGVQVVNGEFVITQKSLQALVKMSCTSNDSSLTSSHVLEEKNDQNCQMSPRKSIERNAMEFHDTDEASRYNKKICAVRELACAILQLEQSIELKYIKKPLVEENNSEDDKLYQLKRWEASLMTATSISQLFLHLHILDSSICWSKSVVNTRCVACKRRSDAEKMLLCDGCNRGTHLFCLKPKLTKVPEGDWYCPKCEPEFKKDHSEKKRKSASGEMASKDAERRPSKSRRMTHNDVCEACGLRYNLILCSSCPMAFHLECVVPSLKELPEGLWTCPECDAEGGGEVEEKENETSSSRRSSRRKSGPSDHLLNNSLLHDLLSDLMCHRDSWPFLQPVRKADAPRYHIIVKKPMDFGTMKYKLNRAHYKHNSEFIDDALLVFANCRMYNENDGEVYKCGARLSEFFKKRCKDMGFHCRD